MQVNDVPAQQGATWVKDAFLLFRAQPLPWIALAAAWVVLLMGSLFLPVVGGVIAVLQPAFFAGFAIACRQQESGGRVAVGHLFAALRVNPRPLVMLGALTSIAYLALFVLVYELGAPWPDLPTPAAGSELQTLQALLDGREWVLVLYFAVDSVLRALLWFSAPVLAFTKMPAWHAIRWSVFACLSNLLPIALFGMLMTLIFLAALLTGGLGLVVAMPLLAISNYTSYRRVFSE
jgi:uncharacterized membrane protein